MVTKVSGFRLGGALIDRMKAFEKETGISQTEQVKKALGAWLTEQEQFRAQLRRSLMRTVKEGK